MFSSPFFQNGDESTTRDYTTVFFMMIIRFTSFHSEYVLATSNKVHFQLLMNLDFQSIIFISTDQLATGKKKFKPGKNVFSDKIRE